MTLPLGVARWAARGCLVAEVSPVNIPETFGALSSGEANLAGRESLLGSGRWVCSGPASALGASGINYSPCSLLWLDYCILSFQWDGRKGPVWCLLWYILCLLNFLGKWKEPESLHIHLPYAYVLQRYWRIALMFRLLGLPGASYPGPQCPGEAAWTRLSVGNAPVSLVFRNQNVKPFLAHLNWETQVTTVHLTCVRQGSSLCPAGMFFPHLQRVLHMAEDLPHLLTFSFIALV